MTSTTVVGAGIAGVACARQLVAAGHPARVLDRGRAPGGRMAGRTIGGRVVDLGASYLTAEHESFAAVVTDWCDRGLARPWTDTFAVADPDGLRAGHPGPMRYAAPGGLRGLVVDLAAGLGPEQERTVGGLGELDTERVVLAMPDPQAHRVLTAAPIAGAGAAGTAAAVTAAAEWEPVLAVALSWPTRQWNADLHGVFVNDDPTVAFVADDGDRRGDGAAVLVAHSTGPFAAAHLTDPEAAGPVVAAAVRRVLVIGAEPEHITVHRWSFARPVQAREQWYWEQGGLGLCGDGWGGRSRVEAAWRSGDALGRAWA